MVIRTKDEVFEELETTSSLCPRCLKLLPARIVTDGRAVYMEKECSDHGYFRSLVWSDVKFYLYSLHFSKPPTPFAKSATNVEKGCPFDCGLCPNHKQHTCLAILEVTGNCNLTCPICLASSEKEGMYNLTIEDVREALISLLDHEGRPTPLQLSGGEPTVRKDLPDLIAEAKSLGFRYVEINTNGIALAKQPELAKLYAEAGLTGVYLQFDGVSDDVYSTLRGKCLMKLKEEAVTNAKKAGLNVVLAVTGVNGVNDHQFWDVVYYALKRRLDGVNFQPFAMQGRYPKSQLNPLKRITNSDVAHLLEVESGGLIKADDFIPIPCPDPRCQIMTFLAVDERGAIPITRLMDINELTDYYSSFTDPDKMEKAVKDLKKLLYDICACSPTNKGECCDLSLPRFSGRLFPVSSHAMMDVWNTDVHRLEWCCIHELTPDGRLVPFCLYNYTSTDGKALYRNKDSLPF